MDEEQVFEKVLSPSFGLYYTCIQPVAHVAYKAIPLVTNCSSSNSLTRMCVHLVRHYWEANFEAFAPQHTTWTTSVPWTHSGRHLCSSNRCVDHIRYFHGIHWRIYTMVTRVPYVNTKPCIHHDNEEVNKLQAHYLEVEFYQFARTKMQNSPHMGSKTCMALRIEVQHSIPYVSIVKIFV
jgi:hypothetical protein